MDGQQEAENRHRGPGVSDNALAALQFNRAYTVGGSALFTSTMTDSWQLPKKTTTRISANAVMIHAHTKLSGQHGHDSQGQVSLQVGVTSSLIFLNCRLGLLMLLIGLPTELHVSAIHVV